MKERNPIDVHFVHLHLATKVIRKYKIQSDRKDQWCIVANAKTAVIVMGSGKSFIVCKLPGFTQQSCVQIDFNPLDLSISSDYLLVMGMTEITEHSAHCISDV